MKDLINHPDHYTWHPIAECNEVVQEFEYNPGTAIAYIWRHAHKGTPVQDLRKAIKHLEFECARLTLSAQANGTARDPSFEQVETDDEY